MILEIAGLALLVAVAAFLVAPMLRTGRRQAIQSKWPRMRSPADPGEAYVVERELPARAIAFAAGTLFLLFALVFVFIAFD